MASFEQGSVDEEFILLLLCALVMEKPFLLLGNCKNVDYLLNSLPLDVPIVDLTLQTEDELLNTSMTIQEQTVVYTAQLSDLWTLPSLLLNHIPVSFIVTKPFPMITTMQLLSIDVLNQLKSNYKEIYSSPHILVKIHKIINEFYKSTVISRYDGSKNQFNLLLKAFAVVLEKDFVNDAMIPAMSEKAMVHKLYYEPNLTPTISPDKRSFIEERKSFIVAAVKKFI